VSLPSGWDADEAKFDLVHEAMIQGMHQNGYVWLKQSSHAVAMRLKNLLGESLYVTHVKENTQSKSLLTKKKALAPHTDHHDVDFILWYVHDHCDKGGETHIYPTDEIMKLKTIRMLQRKDRLLTLKCSEHKIFEDDPGAWPVCQFVPGIWTKGTERGDLFRHRWSMDRRGRALWYYSFWLAKPKDDNQKLVFRLLQESVEQLEPLRGHLKKGDIFIFDNRLNLHARTEYFDSKRHLERHWVKAIL
jgi:hypothetical protein